MSLGSVIDFGVASVGRGARFAVDAIAAVIAWTIRKTWRPAAKLVAFVGGVIVASHFYCPLYIRTERDAIDKLTPASAQAMELRTWEKIADDYAAANHRNRCLVRAVIKVESDNCTNLVSGAGAMGCMQLMAGTASDYGVKSNAERLDAEANIHAGTTHLFRLIDQYGVFTGLQVYNAGLKRVNKTKESREYPHKILKAWMQCEDEVINGGIRN